MQLASSSSKNHLGFKSKSIWIIFYIDFFVVHIK